MPQTPCIPVIYHDLQFIVPREIFGKRKFVPKSDTIGYGIRIARQKLEEKPSYFPSLLYLRKKLTAY